MLMLRVDDEVKLRSRPLRMSILHGRRTSVKALSISMSIPQVVVLN
jgi:hypothetical protein